MIWGPPETPKRGAPVPFFFLWGRLGQDLGPSLGILEGFLDAKATNMPPRAPKTSPGGLPDTPRGLPEAPQSIQEAKKLFQNRLFCCFVDFL